MWVPAARRDRGVMFRTALPAMTPLGVAAAYQWPYIDSPDCGALP